MTYFLCECLLFSQPGVFPSPLDQANIYLSIHAIQLWLIPRILECLPAEHTAPIFIALWRAPIFSVSSRTTLNSNTSPPFFQPKLHDCEALTYLVIPATLVRLATLHTYLPNKQYLQMQFCCCTLQPDRSSLSTHPFYSQFPL